MFDSIVCAWVDSMVPGTSQYDPIALVSRMYSGSAIRTGGLLVKLVSVARCSADGVVSNA